MGIVSKLLAEKPAFHGREDAGTKNFTIQPKVLQWMEDTLQPGASTLETGCGYTTVLFASLGGSHTVISPFDEEHELIRQWCANNDVDSSNVNFVADFSQNVIHSLAQDPLDLVLIDGDHAFPAPFLDWYYTADRLRRGGLCMVDDTQIRTGAVLRDFLVSESERWQLHQELGKTSIYERITDEPVAQGVRWVQQPWCEVIKKSAPTGLRKLFG